MKITKKSEKKFYLNLNITIDYNRFRNREKMTNYLFLQ